MKQYEIIHGDCRAVLHELPEASVQCVVTSPPYWGLRDYGLEGAGIGLEETLAEYIDNMVAVFQGVRRVLRDDGTVFLNLGDAYTSGGRATFRSGVTDNKGHQVQDDQARPPTPNGLKPKDLIGLPWRVALALQADGWWLRRDIIWHKPNPMPESVTDRPAGAHEYVFLLTKRVRYFYDAEAVKVQPTRDWWNENKTHPGNPDRRDSGTVSCRREGSGRNLRSVWTIPTESFKAAHFATYPRKLVEPCIKAGTSDRGRCWKCCTPWVRVVEKNRYPTRPGRDNKIDETGMAYRNDQRHETATRTVGWEPGCKCFRDQPLPCTVLDPFCGSGTTGVVATQLGRRFIGIELNADYCEMARRRIENPERVTEIPDAEGQQMMFEATETDE